MKRTKAVHLKNQKVATGSPKVKKEGCVGEWLRRIGVYVTGMFILALGVSFSIKSSLGVSPLSSLPYVISRVIGVDMGLITTLVFISFVLIQMGLLRGEIKLNHLLQIGAASLFGSFVSLTNRLLSMPVPSTYPVQLVFLGVSLLLVGGGIMLYLVGDLVSLPSEGLVLAIVRKYRKSFSVVKVSFDCIMVSSALILSILSGNGFMGVREGTLILALGIGKVAGLLMKWFRPVLMTFCYGKEWAAREIQ